jgi:methionine aminotransferase
MTKPSIESKLADVGTTIFTVMSRLAEECQAINLAQGFPDFDPPDALLTQVSRHLRSGHNQYAPMAGVMALRVAIAAKLERYYGLARDPESEITVTSGATEALFCAIQAVIAAGQEAIVFDPAYDAYDPAVRLAGGRVIHIPLRPPLFEIDWDVLERCLSARTRLIVINSPNNPTGRLIGPAELDQLAALIRPYDCYVLSDEVYEHIVFDGAEHASVLGHPELAARSFVVSSFGKTFHATGWKVGYCVAPTALSAEFRRVHQFVTFATTTPLQYGLADYLADSPDYARGLAGFYAQKRDAFTALLAGSRWRALPSQGTYFQLVDYSAISDLNDLDFARWLTREHGVAVIPISSFYQQPPDARLVRFCFAKETRTLEAAARRIAAL